MLTDQADYDGAKNYWEVLKFRLKEEGNESVTNCNQLKMVSPKDGKRYKTDVADTEQMFPIIQSIPYKKAEPFKQWMAEVAKQRLGQVADPELFIEQAVLDWRRKGYSENWINNRIKSIEVRKGLTDEWDRAGVSNSSSFQQLEKEKQREALRMLLDIGASVRQLQRLTGLGRGLIQRV